MSITPGWKAKEWDEDCDGLPVTFSISQTRDYYYLNNGSEYKSYPNNQGGWEDLCDDLKGMTP